LIRVVLIQSQKIHGRRRKYKPEGEQQEEKPEGHFYDNEEGEQDTITKVTGMYKWWF
jgi:hypothetical protein